MGDVIGVRRAKGGRDIGNAVAWFYARFLSGQSDERTIARVSTILFAKEHAALPAARGKWERAALEKDNTLKKDFLAAQLRDIVEVYGEALRMTGAGEYVPESVRRGLDERIDAFEEETARRLAAEAQTCFLRDLPAQETARRLSGIFEREARSASEYAEICYTRAAWRRLLSAAPERLYRFAVEETAGTCERCREREGKLYTLGQLEEEGLLPPLHPNCRCALVPADGSGATREWEDPEWYEPALENLAGVPGEIGELLRSFVEAQRERYDRGGVLSLLDAATFGMVSGAWNSMSARTRKMLDEPDVYSIGNWLTGGAFDLVKGALDPDEPLSLEHLLNALGLASVLVEALQAGRASAARRKSRKQARRAKGKPLARLDTGDLEVVEVSDPQYVNDELFKEGYTKPPYALGTEVKIVRAGNEKYVRVYSLDQDGVPNKCGRWMMRKADIVGLTPEQIADKFALPQKPTHICDVLVPNDFMLQTGIANRVPGWGNGGGQQFDTMGIYLDKSLFVNDRLLQ